MGRLVVDSKKLPVTCYLALVHPKSGTIHLVLVSEQGEPLEQRSMCGRLETEKGQLMAPPQDEAACLGCQKHLARLNRGGAGIEALRAGLRRVP